MMTKMTSMRADLGGDEGTVIRHYLLSSRIGRSPTAPHADKIKTTELSPFQYFQTK